jgi:hypothetical protein
MPEQSKRIVILGLQKAEADFSRYVLERLQAERSTDVLAQEIVDLETQALDFEAHVAADRPRSASFSELGLINADLDRAAGGL